MILVEVVHGGIRLQQYQRVVFALDNAYSCDTVNAYNTIVETLIWTTP